MTEQEMRDEINRLAPFHHKIELPYNLSTHLPELSRRPVEYTRVDNLVRHAFPALIEACGGTLQGKRVLDIACNCGGFAVEAAKLKSEFVLGIDMVDHYIEQANFIRDALGLDNVSFRTMDVESIDEATSGLFHVTFCFGILYHLENPVLAMKRIASVTKELMLVDTTVLRTPFYWRLLKGNRLWRMNFPGGAPRNSRDATTSRWRANRRAVQFEPAESAVIGLLEFLGFSEVEKIAPAEKGLEKRYYDGSRATFLAFRK